jgi:hypothetical protein
MNNVARSARASSRSGATRSAGQLISVPAPGPGGKTDDRLTKWKDSLARDPWVDECVSILADMK